MTVGQPQTYLNVSHDNVLNQYHSHEKMAKEGVTRKKHLLTLEVRLVDELRTVQEEVQALAKLRQHKLVGQAEKDMQQMIHGLERDVQLRSSAVLDIKREISQLKDDADTTVQTIITRLRKLAA